jgi:SAM-dependent methyltransferase
VQRVEDSHLTTVMSHHIAPAAHNGSMPPPWMLDELAHAGLEHLDPEFVAGYERKAGYVGDDRSDRRDGTSPDEDVDVLRAHGLQRTSTLVDLGAGTGRFAVAAAAHCRRVIAVDISPAMLRVVRERAVAAGASNVEIVQAGFLSYRHTGPPADAVHTRNALHQLPDFWKAVALDRTAGMLRAGGILRVRDLIYDFEPSAAEDVIARWLAAATDDPAAGYTSADLADHIRSEHSTFRWLFEPMLAAAGFDIVTVDYRGAVYGAYTCAKRRTGAAG